MKIFPLFVMLILGSCAQAPTFKKTSTPVVFLHDSHFSVDVWRDVIKNWPTNQERTFLTLAIPNRMQGLPEAGPLPMVTDALELAKILGELAVL